MKVNYVGKISSDDMFNDILNYNSVTSSTPDGINESPKEGTWIVDYEDDNSTVKVYHCKDINGKMSWLKLPTVRYMGSSLFINTSTLMALKSVIDICPSELKSRITELINN